MATSSEYREFGWADAASEPYHRLLWEPVLQWLPRDGSPILDVGCGNGFLANRLIEQGYNVYGVDASREGVAIADRINPGHFFVHDVASGVLPEPLRGIPFKTVLSTEVIEHLYDPHAYVLLIKRILESNGGGLFIVSTPYHGYLKNVVLALLNRMDYHYSALWEGGHIKFWSRATLTMLLEQSGFEEIRFRGVGRLPYLWNHMILAGKI